MSYLFKLFRENDSDTELILVRGNSSIQDYRGQIETPLVENTRGERDINSA